jgi:hypothetical protein
MCLNKEPTVKTYGGSGVPRGSATCSFCFNVEERAEMSLARRLLGPQRRSGLRVEEKTYLSLGTESGSYSPMPITVQLYTVQ